MYISDILIQKKQKLQQLEKEKADLIKEIELLEEIFIKEINDKLKQPEEQNDGLYVPECCRHCQSYIDAQAKKIPLICYCTLPYSTYNQKDMYTIQTNRTDNIKYDFQVIYDSNIKASTIQYEQRRK